MITERPILFSAPMVRAILSGTKTQTRRVVKGACLEWLDNFTPEFVALPENNLCPYGRPGGDRLWVRETFAHIYRDNTRPESRRDDDVAYKADNPGLDEYAYGSWKPSIHMPRWASRLTLEITGVRVERLQDISEADASAEGLQFNTDHLGPWSGTGERWWGSARGAFKDLWQTINGDGSWDANPWVWVVEFKRLDTPAA